MMMMMMMITKGYGVRATTIEDQKFHVTDGQNTRDQIRVIRFRVIRGPKAHDQTAFCAFCACVITTWRLDCGLLLSPAITDILVKRDRQ